jgi:hypothetical protein
MRRVSRGARGTCLATAIGLALALGACGADDESPSNGAAATRSTPEQTTPHSSTAPKPADRLASSGKVAAKDVPTSGDDSPAAKRVEPYREDFDRKLEAAERQQRENERKAAATPPAPTPAPKPKAGCHPSYQPCLDPGPSDYDCKGSSDDGPAYTGPVLVVGPDEYGLDPDGNGAGCDLGE